ncbi:hypothetical protein [Falsibacillus albus]|uniref:Uncharacterized protein n=1 Tax=Falsibacillus albus TaxID=2478915 RepID=A0A3L7JTN2_9BACI|nr:hypothetical protein [Falsibacillus albus]RLQ93624.1 hypothetical protein D9X91_16705 [Falsibacillus albus]
MSDIGQLRIYVDEQHFPLYHHMGKTLFQQNSQFFTFCAMIGKKENQKSLVPQKHELCRAVTLSEHEWTMIKSVYYKENGQLGSYKEMTQLMEQYAHAGLTQLLENDLQDLVSLTDGQYHFTKEDHDIQLYLMEYTLRVKDEVPF